MLRGSEHEVRWQHEEDIDECPNCEQPFSYLHRKVRSISLLPFSCWLSDQFPKTFSTGVTVWVCTDRPCNFLATGRSAAVASESASDQCQSAAVTPPVNLSFFVPVSRLQTFNSLDCCRQLPVGMVVSAIAVFRQVDNPTPSRLQIVYWPNYKLKLFANSNCDSGNNSGSNLPTGAWCQSTKCNNLC